ncbi:MAG: cyanophycinase [Erythrobacter sp.]
MVRAYWFAAGMALLTPVGEAYADTGTLVIVGGGLDPANAEVYTALLEARPADAPGIAIIPAASESARGSMRAVASAFERHGARREDIIMVHLALLDDPATPDVDESTWRGNADDPDEIAKVARAGAIWFVGGDQQRITAVLREPDGGDTPMLAAIRRRLAGGAVVGGTSAGAAIMSRTMMTQGSSLGPPLVKSGGDALQLGAGLGFFEAALIDQHFGERARLGRLAVALSEPGQPGSLGLGIDEDTALIVKPDSGTARVAGSGYVTLLDARAAHRTIGTRTRITGLSLGLAGAGDTIDLAAWHVTPASARQPVTPHAAEEAALPAGGGMAYGDQRLAAVVGEALLEGGVMQVERHSFAGSEGLTYRFRVTPASAGWWGRDARGRGRYTITGIGFDILPVTIAITPAE